MIDITTSPSLNNATQSLDLLLSISSRLAGRKDFASFAIKNGIQSNLPAETVLVTVVDMYEDNPVVVIDLLGKPLTDKIINHVKQ